MIVFRLAAMVAAILTVVGATPLPATAKDDPSQDTRVVPLLVAPASLRPDSAYLLLRTSTAKSGMFPIQHVLLRLPTDAEMALYRAGQAVPPNTFVVDSKKFLEDGEMRTILLEVPPGTYVLFGITVGNRGIVTCNCLGTVRFAAKPGAITDLGSLYADKVHKASPVPHLEDNIGPSMFNYGFVLGEGLVPADATTPVPTALRMLPVSPAHYEIVAEFDEPGASSINRLAPVPGLLGYDRGRAVDLRTGKIVD